LAKTTAKNSTQATVKKTKAHQCAVFKKNAKKARHLYSTNKKQAKKINVTLKGLVKEQKRMPSSTKITKKVVKNQIMKLQIAKKKKVNRSLKYLEKHIKYTKAFKRSCAQKRVKSHKKHWRGQDIGQYLSIAAH
jgi:G:T/U-mismatch repair DNA glycosylase